MASENQENVASQKASSVSTPPILSGQELQRRIAGRVAEMRGLDARDVDVDKPYSYYGLSSLEIVLIATDLEEWLGRPLDATLLWDYPTIHSLTDYLATEHPK